jgi:hypothetical protein
MGGRHDVKKTLRLDPEIIRLVEEAAQYERRTFTNAVEVAAERWAQAIILRWRQQPVWPGDERYPAPDEPGATDAAYAPESAP